MSELETWLAGLAEKGGKGTVDNIDARALGRVAAELKAGRERIEALEKANVRLEEKVKSWVQISNRWKELTYEGEWKRIADEHRKRAEQAEAARDKALADVERLTKALQEAIETRGNTLYRMPRKN